MTETLSSNVKTVTDLEAIGILLDLRYAELLKVFFKEACSIDEAARKTGLKANTLYRWVQKWCALELLGVAATRPKRGRPVKLYKTTAERFFIPFASTSAPTYEALLYSVDGEFQKQFYKSLMQTKRDSSPHWGYSVGLGQDDTVHLKTYKNAFEPFDFDDPAAPPTVNIWNTELYLTLEEAQVLRAQLYSFWHSREKKPGTRPYLIQLRLAPATD